MKKILGLLLILNIVFGFCGVQNVFAQTVVAKKNKKLDAQVESRRIPKGTRLKVKLLDPISTKTSTEGEMFSATLLTDEKINNSMILPAGTLIRGYVLEIKPAKIASIGAVLYLKFDHIVTPSGTQLQIKSALAYNNENYAKITVDGGLREQAGYGDALKENWHNRNKKNF